MLTYQIKEKDRTIIHKEDCTCPICQIPRLEKTIAEQAEQIRQLINLVALAEGRDTKQTEQISKLRAELVIEKSNRKIAEANRTLFQNTALKYQETQTAQICKLQAENLRLKAEKLQQAEQIGELQQEIATRNDTMNATVEELMSAKDEIRWLKDGLKQILVNAHQESKALVDIARRTLNEFKAAPPPKDEWTKSQRL